MGLPLTSRLRALLLIIALLGFAAAGTGLALITRGSAPPAPPALSTASAPGSSRPSPSVAPFTHRTPAAGASAPTDRVSSGPAAASSHLAVDPAIPVAISIPAIGVSGPVMQVGLAADGTLQVPPVEAGAPAGWYRGSPVPGEPGPSVIVGHVTVGSYGEGIFYRLAELRAGDRIEIRQADGNTQSFTVDDLAQYPKSAFPTASVYGDTATPSLRLITCAGDRTTDGYSANLVVYAHLT